MQPKSHNYFIKSQKLKKVLDNEEMLEYTNSRNEELKIIFNFPYRAKEDDVYAAYDG